MFLKKRVTRVFHLQVRGRARVKKYSRDTGKLLETTPWKYNTMETKGIDWMLHNVVNAGTHSGKALTAAKAWLAVGNQVSPMTVFENTYNNSTTPASTTLTKAAPSYAQLWQFNDDSVSVRTNQNEIELWYEDPDAGEAGTGVRISHIAANQGSKPANENWHWQYVLELYSTDADFVSGGFEDMMQLVSGNRTIFYDGTRTWFRPFTSADAGLGTTGQKPDAAPTVNDAANTITWIWTVVDGTYNGAWDKTEVGSGTTYAGLRRLRYAGCKTDGTGCGTKAAGEEYEYTYVFTLAQGS